MYKSHPRTLEHPLSAFSILALATISKIIVVTVRPRLKVLITTALVGDSSTLPLVCWQFVVIQNQFSNKSNDPVLTFARGDTIHFYQVQGNFFFPPSSPPEAERDLPSMKIKGNEIDIEDKLKKFWEGFQEYREEK